MLLLKFIKIFFILIISSLIVNGDGNHAQSGDVSSSEPFLVTIPFSGITDISGANGSEFNPNGGHGLIVNGNHYRSGVNHPVIYRGGSGALVVNTEAPHGGSGLSLSNWNFISTNITYVGGSGGISFALDGNSFGQTGHGIEWDVSSGNNSSLSLVGGTVSNGIDIISAAGSILDLSYTNSSIFGGIDKTGSGILNINSRDINSLEDLDIQDGLVVFTDNLTVESAEHINLSSTSSSLVASNGIFLVGGISGSGTVEVYNDMEISGVLNGSLKVDLVSPSNSLTLQSGYNISGATFNADGVQDSLIFPNSGIYNAENLGMETVFQDFEFIQLSDVGDTWESSTSFSYQVDGGVSSDDVIAFASSGTYSFDDFISISNNISGFESYGLSSGDDIWIAKVNDVSLGGSIGGRSGEDTISFLEYRPDSTEIGSNYIDFEGALLESGTNTWHNTSDYSQLQFIDGSNGEWTLSYVSNTIGISASAVSNNISSGYYRNFDHVKLTEYDDTWNITPGENNLISIDGRSGINTLSGSLSSSLSVGSTYNNFDYIELSDPSNNWTVTPGDTNLLSIKALHTGVDYLSYIGTDPQITNSLMMGDSRFYQGFDQVNLNIGNDQWRATTNDLSILINVDGGSGSDLLSYIDYENDINVFSKATHLDTRYFKFEEIELSTYNDTWLYSNDDSSLVLIDGEDGEDELLIQGIGSLIWNQNHAGRYSSFERLLLDNSTLSFSDYDLGGISDIILDNNTVLDLEDGSLNIPGIYQHNASSILLMNALTNFNVIPRLSANQINFNSGSIIQFSGDASSFAVGNRYTNYVAQANAMIEVDNNLFSNNPGVIDVKDWYIDSESLYVIFDRRSLTDQNYGFNVENGSKLEKVLTEIDSMQSQQSSEMANLVFAGNITLADLENVYDRTIAVPRSVSHQRNGMLRVISERTNERRMMINGVNSPKGPKGPNAEQSGISIWGKGYTANGDASADNNLEGYDLSGVGSVFGIDYTKGKLVLGAAAGVYNQTMKMDSSGEYKGTGTHATGYASYGIDGWFLESSLSVADSSLDFDSEGAFNLEADYAANDLTFYIGSGYIMRSKESSWTPEIGFIFNTYDQASTSDISQEVVPVNLDSISTSNIKMRLGLTGGFKKDLIGRELLTQIKLRWMNTVGIMDEETDFQLSGGVDTYQTPLLSSAKSTVEFGVGTQLRMNRSFALLMGFDYELGGGYTANRISAGLRYSF